MTVTEFEEFTVRLHKDEVKILPACVSEYDSTIESALVNGILAQIIRASKMVKYEDIVRNGRIRHPDEIDNSCPQCSRNLDEWNLCHTCGECYEVD